MPILEVIGNPKAYGWTASLGGPNFIAALPHSSEQYGINYDSSGNVYTTSYSNSATGVFIQKREPEGAITWQARYVNGGSAYHAQNIVVDSTGNIYVATLNNGFPQLQVVKLTSAGAITWQRELGNSYGSMSKAIKIGPDGNIYIGGTFNNGSGVPFNFVAKYDSTGTLTFHRAGTTNQTGFRDIAIDSGNNILGCGWYQPGSFERATIQKYNSAGTSSTWGFWYGPASGTANYLFNSGIAIDSSDNVYSHGDFNNGSGTTNGVLYKLNSSGTLQWQRFVNYGSQTVARDVASDTSGNTYCLGYNNSGNYALVINKTDTSGNQVFSRSISVSGGYVLGYKIETDGTYLYISGAASVSPNFYGLTIKVPADGTKTGTYTVGPMTITYSSGGASMSTSSIASNSLGLPISTTTMSGTTPTNTMSTTSLVENRANF